MNRKRVLMIGAVAVLALLNAWRWLGDESPQRASHGVSRAAVSAAELSVQGVSAVEISPAVRNPFQPKIVVVAAPVVTAPPPPPAPILPPPKTAEELEAEAARAELATIKLVGVVFKNDKPQAFLVKGDQMVIAVAGEIVAGRFTIDKITEDAVVLSDPKTAVSGRIAISGS